MKSFGKSYLLDMYECKPNVCDSLEDHYRFLEELVFRIKMTPMGKPIVMHAPVRYSYLRKTKKDKEYNKGINIGGDIPYYTNGLTWQEEIFPDKAGVSAWIPLIESGIQIHSIEPTHFSTIDVYTCGELDHVAIREFAQRIFGFESCEEYLISRGNRYANRSGS